MHKFQLNINITYQVVVWSDPKQLSEVAKGHRSIGFKSEVWEVVGWSEVTALTISSING